MEFGDFFRSAPFARPVNPKQVKFTAIAKGAILPGGSANPNRGGMVKAEIEATMVFVSGEETATARLAATRAVQERFKGVPWSDADFDNEFVYQVLAYSLLKKDGARMFPDPGTLREHVGLKEAGRVYGEYLKYADEEHGGSVDDATFREPEEAGPRVAVGASG
jgi:hypothetical protein